MCVSVRFSFCPLSTRTKHNVSQNFIKQIKRLLKVIAIDFLSKSILEEVAIPTLAYVAEASTNAEGLLQN